MAGARALARVAPVQISPSILAADFANLQSELEAVANADWAHVDVMDNHFVPNLTLGLPVVEALVQVSPVPLDCHLMIEDPDRWAPPYAEAGARSVTFHVEAASDAVGTARAIRAAGARAAFAVKPGTPFAPYEGLLPEVDMVLVMTVEPGFGGQSFMADQMPKVREVREAVRRHGGEIWVQVDGGVAADTIEQCAEAGADVFVAGSAVYGADSAAEAVDDLRALVARHAHP
jgi:ribulose-phosphate 3-epimerase